MSTLHPEVLWAQRSSETDSDKCVVYVTINLPDIVESSLKFNLTSTGFTFAATTGNPPKGIPEKHYAIDVPFYDEIDAEKSQKNLTSRSLALKLLKKNVTLEYWPRLTKDKLPRGATIKTDFNKWVDEDDQTASVEVPDEDFGGGFDPSMLSGLGGGAGGNPDFSSMMSKMGAAGMDGLGGPSPSATYDEPDDDSDDDDGPPPLEETDK